MKIINENGYDNILPVMIMIPLPGIIFGVIDIDVEAGFAFILFSTIINFAGIMASILLLQKRYLVVISQLLMQLTAVFTFFVLNNGTFFPMIIVCNMFSFVIVLCIRFLYNERMKGIDNDEDNE